MEQEGGEMGGGVMEQQVRERGSQGELLGTQREIIKRRGKGRK